MTETHLNHTELVRATGLLVIEVVNSAGGGEGVCGAAGAGNGGVHGGGVEHVPAWGLAGEFAGGVDDGAGGEL